MTPPTPSTVTLPARLLPAGSVIRLPSSGFNLYLRVQRCIDGSVYLSCGDGIGLVLRPDQRVTVCEVIR